MADLCYNSSVMKSTRTPGALARLAGWAYDRRRLVLVVWIVVLVAVTVLSQMVGSNYQDKFSGGHSESQQAQDLLQQRFPARAGDTAEIVFRTSPDPVTTPANQQAIQAVLAKVKGLPRVAGIVSPFDQPASQISQRDNHIAFADVQFDRQTGDLATKDVQAVIDAAQSGRAPGLEVELGGSPISKAVFATPGTSEAIGIFAAVIILLVAFGSVIAMGLPIVTALFGIGIGFAVISLISHGVVVPTFGPQLAAMIGIGVGIDYALFIVTRYREGLAEGREPRPSVVRSLDTSGRAVLFAGCTVVISLLGMLLLGASFVYGLAFGSIAAVILVMAASLTLLPALLGFAGRNVDKWHIPAFHRTPRPDHRTFWWRWSRTVQRHPWALGGGALAILIVLAIPVLSLQMLFSDAGNDPTSLTTRRAYDLLAEGFGPGANGPLFVVVQVPAGTPPDTTAKIAAAVQQTPGVAFVSPPQANPSGDTAVIRVVPQTSAQDSKTESLVHHLRDDVLPTAVAGTPAKALVGGVTAAGIDAAARFSDRLFWVIGGVVLLSFLLLMAVFRSIAVPIKAAIMNLLSIGAAYGVIVAVFQWGWLDGVVGVDKTGPIDPWIPLMLFTILFGLSMDYEVFLLSRIREEWLRTGDNGTAVADGLARTARVITAAAAIMFCVFASFVIGDVRVLKVFGLGLAVAVLIDATIVRLVLVPATMELLGKANWWFPKWLDRIVPHLDVEGAIEPEPVREPEPAGVG
jgi:RND superfamily putative drug exporter